MVGIAAAALPLITSALSQAGAGTKQAGEVSKELLGYDFPGLLVKLFIYFTAAYIFAKFMEFVLHATGFFKWFFDALGVASLGAFKIQEPPQALKDLFLDGYQGVKYWDLIKGIAIIAVGFEAYMYYKSNKALGGQPSVMTLAIFGVIESGLIAITIPELMAKLTGRKDSLYIAFSKDKGLHGEAIGVAVTHLIPSAPVRYGWKELNFETPMTAQADGALTFTITVATSTPTGKYTIYFDQTDIGGKRYEETFEVLEGISA